MGAAHGAIPLTAGVGAGAATTGALIGSVGGPLGILAGLGVGAGVGIAAGLTQDKLLALLGWDKPFTEARKANPISYDVGEAAAGLITLRPTGNILERGIGAAAGAGIEGANQLVHGEFDPARLGVAAGAGFAMPNLNKLGSKFEQAGQYIGARYRGGNKNPDLKPVAGEEADAAGRPVNEEGPTLADVGEEVAVETPAAQAADMPDGRIPLGPGGVALEQQPAPKVPEIGNKGQAAGSQHEASPPSSPARNLAKDQPATHPEVDPTASKVIDTEPMKSDIKAALTEEAHTQSEAGEAHPPPAEGNARPEPSADVPPAPEARALPEGHVPLGEPALPQGHVPLGKPAAPPQRRSEGPLTPDERKLLTAERKSLVEAGPQANKILAALDKVPERQQLHMLEDAAAAIKKYKAEAEGKVVRPSGEVRKGDQRMNSIGAPYNKAEELTRQERSIKLFKDGFKDFGPGSEKAKGIDVLNPNTTAEVRDYAKQVWAELTHRNGGRDPLKADEKHHYIPTKAGHALTRELGWLRAIRDAAKRGDVSKLALAHSHNNDPEMIKLNAETKAIEDSSAFRPSLNDAGADAILARHEEQAPKGWVDVEPWSDPKGLESKVYGQQQRALRAWINDLHPVDQQLLIGKHEDLHLDVKTTRDPAKLLETYKKDLAEIQKRTPAGEITSEVDMPAREVLPEQIPAEPQKASIPAFETEAAARRAKMEAQRAARLAGAKPEGKAKKVAERMSDEEAVTIDGDPKSVFETLKDMAKDTSGAGAKKLVAGVVQHFQKQHTPPASTPKVAAGPQANANMKAYIDGFVGTIKDAMNKMNNAVIFHNDDARKLKNNAQKYIKEHKLDNRQLRRIYLDAQHKNLDKLSPVQRKFYDDFVKPLRDIHAKDYQELWDLNEKHGRPLKNLADPNKGGIDVDFFTRHTEDSTLWNRADDDRFDAFSARTLSGYSPNIQPRNFKALRDVGPDPTMSNLIGDRMIVDVQGNKKDGFEVSILRKGQPAIKIKNLSPAFEGELGDVLTLTVKGKKSRWQLDHAATDEIEKATGGTVKYLQDPLLNQLMATASVKTALEQLKLKHKILSSPEFANLTTKDADVAKARGYDPKFTRLDDFGDRYMPKELKYLFDDYAKPGFGGDNAVDHLRKFNQGVAKFINVNAPLVHVWNEGVQVFVARGYRNVWPPSYYKIARAFPEAIKSVNKQDALQREMADAGVHFQLASTMARGTASDYARFVGLDMTKNASKWDPVAKAFNLTLPDAYAKLYRASSDVTWRLSEYMATAHYLELKAEGYTPKQAADKLNKFFSTYQVGSTIFGKRWLQQYLIDPATTLFGRYKANIFQSFQSIAQDMKNGSPAEKAEAFSQAVALGALGLFGYAMINKGLEKLTGIEGLELRPRGMSAFPAAVAGVTQGEKGIQGALAHVTSAAPAIDTAAALYHNKDFRGKDIFPQGNWARHPSIPVEGVAKVAEHAARAFVSPYSQISQGYSRPGEEGGVKGAAKAFGWEQLGISEPSEKARRFKSQQERFNERNFRSRNKKDAEGVIPSIGRMFTGG